MNSGNLLSETDKLARCELASEVLRLFGGIRFSATGWSMLPTVWSGDVLLVERVNPHYIQVGNIAVVGREGGLCAHRVVALPDSSTGQVWITQGDAISNPDPPVIESELLGRVTGVIRCGKRRQVPEELNVMERLLAHVLRRSIFATRVLIYITSKFRLRREPVLP